MNKFRRFTQALLAIPVRIRLTILFFPCLFLALHSHAELSQRLPGYQAGNTNPIIPGYFADPSLVEYQGTYYLYATLDPWGGETLGLWQSTDLSHWEYKELNWPTKTACSSKTSKDSMVWAPSVVRGVDGKFYMYVSVGSEVWAGVAEHPAGPWKNMLGDQPLIPENFKPGYHMIDAEAFIDDDGQAYLYWGSGLKWVNGKCWAVKLSADMKTFDGPVKDVTPSNFFEAPFMLKRNGRYHLMYSSGRTPLDTYQVHSAVGDSPFGPFVEEANSPILVTNHANNVVSPGHHSVFSKQGQHWILYHRHSIPYQQVETKRQISVDALSFDKAGNILKVVPSHRGPQWLERGHAGKVLSATVRASSESDKLFRAEMVLDNNYATRWQSADKESSSWIELDLKKQNLVSHTELRMEYAWKPYRLQLEKSLDGKRWEVIANHREKPIQGSPIVFRGVGKARYLRLHIDSRDGGAEPVIFEWHAFGVN